MIITGNGANPQFKVRPGNGSVLFPVYIQYQSTLPYDLHSLQSIDVYILSYPYIPVGCIGIHYPILHVAPPFSHQLHSHCYRRFYRLLSQQPRSLLRRVGFRRPYFSRQLEEEPERDLSLWELRIHHPIWTHLRPIYGTVGRAVF